jgi:hypothetical protein
MNLNVVAAILLSILAALPAAFAKESVPSINTGGTGVELTHSAPKPPAGARRDAAPGLGADARHCLEFSTNLQIALCAEKYRSRTRNP